MWIKCILRSGKYCRNFAGTPGKTPSTSWHLFRVACHIFDIFEHRRRTKQHWGVQNKFRFLLINTIFDLRVNTLELYPYSRKYMFYGEWNHGQLKVVLVFQKSKGRPNMYVPENKKPEQTPTQNLFLKFLHSINVWMSIWNINKNNKTLGSHIPF